MDLDNSEIKYNRLVQQFVLCLVYQQAQYYKTPEREQQVLLSFVMLLMLSVPLAIIIA